MAQIKFQIQSTGQPWHEHNHHQSINLCEEAAQNWAIINGLKEVTFLFDQDRFFLKFNNEVLSAWIDSSVILHGKTDELVTQLDFARGEYRRRLAGYDKYDH